MFNKKKDGDKPSSDEPKSDDISAPPLKPFSRKGSHIPAKPPAAATFHPEVPRRVPDIPGPAARRADRPLAGDADSKRLVIGRDIRLKGEITSCDKLIVEGHVEVTLSNARAIEVTPSGFFNGVADVEEAEISGRYEGELIARDRLVVRAGGRISGAIRYGRIVIESGGEISGDMQTLGQSEPEAAEQAEAQEPASKSADKPKAKSSSSTKKK